MCFPSKFVQALQQPGGKDALEQTAGLKLKYLHCGYAFCLLRGSVSLVKRGCLFVV